MNKILKKVVHFLIDVIVIALASGAAVVLECEFSIPEISGYAGKYLIGLPVFILLYLAMMVIFNGYRILWKFAGMRDRLELCLIVVLASVPYTIVHTLITGGYPLSVYVTSTVFIACALLFVRAVYKIIYRIKNRKTGEELLAAGKKNVMII